MRRDLHRYRDAFLPLTAAVIAADPAAFGGASPEGLASVAVSFIKGCGIQTVIDLDHGDSRELRTAADRLLTHFARGTTVPGSQGAFAP